MNRRWILIVALPPLKVQSQITFVSAYVGVLGTQKSSFTNTNTTLYKKSFGIAPIFVAQNV